MEEEETQIHHSHNFLWKRILSNKQNINYVIISVTMLVFKKQVTVWDLSMMKKKLHVDEKNHKNWKKMKNHEKS